MPPTVAPPPRTGEAAQGPWFADPPSIAAVPDHAAEPCDEGPAAEPAHPKPAATARTVAAGVLFAASAIVIAALVVSFFAAVRLAASGDDGLNFDGPGFVLLALGFAAATCVALIALTRNWAAPRARTLVLAGSLATITALSDWTVIAATVSVLALGAALTHDRLIPGRRTTWDLLPFLILTGSAVFLTVLGAAITGTHTTRPSTDVSLESTWAPGALTNNGSATKQAGGTTGGAATNGAPNGGATAHDGDAASGSGDSPRGADKRGAAARGGNGASGMDASASGAAERGGNVAGGTDASGEGASESGGNGAGGTDASGEGASGAAGSGDAGGAAGVTGAVDAVTKAARARRAVTVVPGVGGVAKARAREPQRPRRVPTPGPGGVAPGLEDASGGGTAPAPTTVPAPAPAPAVDTASVVQFVRGYYADLNAHRFDAAWAVLSPAVQAQLGPFARWKGGYGRTLSSEPQDLVVGGGAGGEVSVSHVLVARDQGCEGERSFRVTWRLRANSGGWNAVGLSAVALGSQRC